MFDFRNSSKSNSVFNQGPALVQPDSEGDATSGGFRTACMIRKQSIVCDGSEVGGRDAWDAKTAPNEPAQQAQRERQRSAGSGGGGGASLIGTKRGVERL